MELAGFILDALIDCQLTVNNAITIDANKDTPKVQNGKLSLNSKFSSHFFIAKYAIGHAITFDRTTHQENSTRKRIRICPCEAPITLLTPVSLVRLAVMNADNPSNPMAEIMSTNMVNAIKSA